MTEREDPWSPPRNFWRLRTLRDGPYTVGRGLGHLWTAVEDCYVRGWGFTVEFFDDEPPGPDPKQAWQPGKWPRV